MCFWGRQGRGGPSCGCTHHTATATAERGARRATRHPNLHHGRCRGRCRALVIVPPPAPASSSPQYLLGGCTSSAQCGRLGDRAASSHAAAVSVRTRRTRGASPRRCRSGRAPTEHTLSSAELAWLCCGQTWGVLRSTPWGEARPHQHRDRSAARALENYDHRVQGRRRAARALFAPWNKGRPPMEHARRAVRT